ncbi:hypothetical protein M422DRAFT_277089 [Sphaerobolus stellatus SS14]|uniref:Uncharacterized protein n=1 Tax=Sphaerobolus stellatus (strain SS14) TaxID=990650 RepID=A0A0C9TKV6_SPHS4|nr:hypothetical protein M422DRAFT_277089 [Sphaerobolus stellatus SS14]
MPIAAPHPDLIPQLKPKATALSLNTPLYQEVLNHILKITELNETFFGKFQIKRPQLEELINPNGHLSGATKSSSTLLYYGCLKNISNGEPKHNRNIQAQVEHENKPVMGKEKYIRL